MLIISGTIALADEEIEMQAIRAQGAGGQNVNKVSTAIHLRFDIAASSLPLAYKEKLLATKDKRLNSEGVIIIKAQRFRSQEKNRADALARLVEIIAGAGRVMKSRRATRPTRGSVQRRLEGKTRHGEAKRLRGKLDI